MKHTRITGNTESDLTGVENIVWGFAMFYGGFLQVVAGLGEVRRNNLFGYTAFLSYGGFWMSLGTAEILVKLFTLLGETDALGGEIGINPKAAQAMLIMMGVFTFLLWVCTFKQNKALSLLIFSLMMTFFLLAAGIDDYRTDKAAGWVGIFTSAVAFFIGGAELINDIIGEGQEIIPLGHFDTNKFKFAGYFHAPGRIQSVSHTSALRHSMMLDQDEDDKLQKQEQESPKPISSYNDQDASAVRLGKSALVLNRGTSDEAVE
jgi:Predicted membrane protein